MKPAFPTNQYATGISPTSHDTGMTLRDYFAARALLGIMTKATFSYMHEGRAVVHMADVEYIVDSAYEVAEEMMKRRER